MKRAIYRKEFSCQVVAWQLLFERRFYRQNIRIVRALGKDVQFGTGDVAFHLVFQAGKS